MAAAGLQDATIVVIGAGSAGIMAARSLREKGCKKVVVLEADDRSGRCVLCIG